MKIYNINTESDAGYIRYKALKSSSSEVFKHIEQVFYKWLKDSNPANEYEAKYFDSEESVYNLRGAIHGAIEHIFEVMNEYNLPFIFTNDSRLDFDACFGD